MPKLKEVIAEIERLAPPSLAAEWDNSGLQIGEPDAEVTGVLVALDPLPAVVAEARESGCELVVAHHPLFFRPIRSLDLSLGQGKVVAGAVAGGVAVYSAHTPLDRVRDGVSRALAAVLGLRNTSVLEQAEGWPKGTGFGLVGELPKKTKAADAAERFREALGAGPARFIGDPDRPVKKVAVCGGSGSELIGAAAQAGAGLFVTGDVKYHEALAALETGMAVMDAGHYATELPVVGRLAGMLKRAFKKKGWKVRVKVSGSQGEPWVSL